MIPISRPLLGKEEQREVLNVLKSGIIAAGPRVKELEEKFKKIAGSKHAVAVSNGTCAIHAALFASGIGPGDKVAVPPFTFIATANSVLHAGAEPVFVDINEKTFNIDPVLLEKAIKKDRKIKAVIVVHLYGRVCEMDKIIKVCRKYKVKVIEDAAQAHGAKYKNKPAGSWGDVASFSMYATKNMTTGEGGMVTTNSGKTADIVRKFRNHGQENIYYHTMQGYNYRTTDIEAAIGLVQLKKLRGFNAKRRKNAAALKKALKKYEWIKLPEESKKDNHIYHQFTIRVKKGIRDKLVKFLNSRGIGSKIFYPIPIHMQPFYKKVMKKKVKMPVSEMISKEVISLPVYPGLKRGEISKIVRALKEFAGEIN